MKFLGKRKLPNLLLVLLVIFVLILPFIPSNRLLWDNVPQASADTMSNYSYRKAITLNNLYDENGLVGSWHLDGSSVDSSANGNNGTDTNVTYGTSYGKYGGGVSIPSSGGYIKLPAGMFSKINAASITLNAWVYPTNVNNGGFVITESGNNYAAIYLGTSNSAWNFLNQTSNAGVTNYSAGNNSAQVNTWQMVTYTYNASTGYLTSYVNGVQVVNVSRTGNQSYGADSVENAIGAYLQSGSYYNGGFNGYIDEVRFYSRALSSTEVTSLYSSNSSRIALSSYPVLVQNPIYNETGLVGSWHMDGNANDASGNGYNGTSSSVTYGTSYGKFGQGGYFNGSAYIALPVGTQIQGPLTLTAWVNPSTFGSNEGVLVIGDDQGARLFINPSGYPRADVSIGGNWQSWLASSVTVPLNQWSQIAYVVNGANQYIYVNGALTGSSSITSGSITYDSSYPYYIGVDNASGYPFHEYFSGYIDEARIYGRALSTADVSNLYNAHAANNYQDVRFLDSDGTTFLNYYRPVDGKFWVTVPSIPVAVKTIYMVYGNASATDASNVANAPSGLVGDWNMDEPVGSVAYDSSGGGHNGTATGTTVVSGKFGNANNWGSTAGNSNKIVTSGSIGLGTTYTISAWVNYNGVTTNGYIIDFGSNNNSVQYLTTSPGPGICADNTACDGGTLTTGQWYNIVVTKTGSGGTVNIYVNGVQTKSFTGTSNVPGAATIGNYGSLANGWTGSIDEVRVYNRVLSNTEIQGLYNYPTGVLVMSEDPVNAPSVTSVTPPLGPLAGGTSVTIGGSGFAQLYRTPITVTNTGPAVNDYQVVVTNPIYNESGLLASYHFDSGGNLNDSSGNNFALTNSGTTLFNPGKFGSAADFGASNTTNYLTNATDQGIHGGTVSISSWINITTTPGTNVQYVFSSIGDVASRVAYSIGYEDAGGVKRFFAQRNEGGVSAVQANYNFTATTGTWYHLVFTYNGGTGALTLFVNGTNQATASQTGNGTSFITDGIRIGALMDSAVDSKFSGLVDEVRFYNRVLSSTDVSNLYSAHAANNYQDVRFFDSDGVTPLPYWMEQDGRFWVRVPYVPNGTKNIYIQYGVSNMSNGSNGNSTFLWFDNFSGSSLDTTKWTSTVSGSTSVTINNSLSLQSGTTNGSYGGILSTTTFPYPVTIDAGVSALYTGDWSVITFLGNAIQISSGSSGYWWGFNHPAGGGYLRKTGMTGTDVGNTAFSISAPLVWNLQVFPSGENGKYNSTAEVSGTDTTYTTSNLKIGLQAQTANSTNTNSGATYTSVRVRRYATTEPTTSVGSETTTSPSATFGGVAATSMTYSNSTSIGGVTPAHALGPVTVAVMNPDGSVGSLLNGFTYGAASGLFLIFE